MSFSSRHKLKTTIRTTLLMSMMALPTVASAHTQHKVEHHEKHSVKETHHHKQQHVSEPKHKHVEKHEHHQVQSHKIVAKAAHHTSHAHHTAREHEHKPETAHHENHQKHTSASTKHDHHRVKEAKHHELKESKHHVTHTIKHVSHHDAHKHAVKHTHHHQVPRKHVVPVDYYTTKGHYGHHRSVWSSLMHFRLTSHFKSKIWHSYEHWAHTPYRYGGTTHRGIDCSAFVGRVFSEVFHIHLPRTSLEQVKLGFKVKKENAHYGDLVFFKTDGGHHHVGVYLDHGRFVNATSSRGVAVSNINHPYWRKRLWQIRRLVAA